MTAIPDPHRPRAVVIGAGFGGLALGIRLQSLGVRTTLLEKLPGPGGRAAVRTQDGFTFDMGPTVLTVPHFLEELFSLEVGRPGLDAPDFPADPYATPPLAEDGSSGGPATRRYVRIVPIRPFYRIHFHDGTWFDYDGDRESTRAQIARLAPEDLDGYDRFHAAAKEIFERGFLQLGYTHFGDLRAMLKVAPELLRLDAVRPLYAFVSRYLKSDKMRRVFSFEPLLIGGNPLRVPALYAMIHFVEKTWGVHYAMGGTGALVNGLVRKFEELGGEIRYGAAVDRIEVQGHGARRRTRGVTLADGTTVPADLVASNADAVHTALRLLPEEARTPTETARAHLRRQSMSLFVLYFGFRDDGNPLPLAHHSILLGRSYRDLLRDVFDRKVLNDDLSQYLHVPTLTDPSLAPPGHHAAYTLVPVPNLTADLDWSVEGPRMADRLVAMLDDRGYVPNLRERIVTRSFVTPDYFARTLNAWLGNGFGPEPILRQSAWLRTHNRHRGIAGLYTVGQGAQPGAGTPSVLMSAKMTARLVEEDLASGTLTSGAAAKSDARTEAHDPDEPRPAQHDDPNDVPTP
ncbi:MAG: phytoene desaturase family protein [Trueperaceae bacterium]